MGAYKRMAGTWLCYAFLAFYSYFLNSMGPITPLLKSELGLSYTVAGLHFSAFALGILVLGFGGSSSVSRFGAAKSLWIGAFGLALGSVPLILCRTPAATIPASFVMGLFGSLILIVVPLKLADLHGELLPVALSEANLIASAVAAVAPLLLGTSARAFGDWRPALAAAALLPFLLFLPLRGLIAGGSAASGMAAAEAAPRAAPPRGEGDRPPRRPLPRAYWAYWACIFLGVAAEFGMVSWSSDFFSSVHGVDKTIASGVLSFFLIAMILGRAAGSVLARRFKLLSLIFVHLAVALGGFFLFWTGGNVAVALVGLFVTGFGISGLYPFLLSLALASAGEQRVRGSSAAILASGFAIMSLPLLLGRAADAFGIRDAYAVVPFVLVSLGAVMAATSGARRGPAA